MGGEEHDMKGYKEEKITKDRGIVIPPRQDMVVGDIMIEYFPRGTLTTSGVDRFFLSVTAKRGRPLGW